MSGAQIKINVRELEDLAKKIGDAKLSPAERKELLFSMAQLVEAQSKERFDTQTGPDGGHWKEITGVTLSYYTRKFITNRSLLVISGGLRESIESRVTGNQALIGATKVYAATHQYGAAQGEFGRTGRNGPIPWGNIPARPYLGLNDDNRAEIAACANSYLMERLKCA